MDRMRDHADGPCDIMLCGSMLPIHITNSFVNPCRTSFNWIHRGPWNPYMVCRCAVIAIPELPGMAIAIPGISMYTDYFSKFCQWCAGRDLFFRTPSPAWSKRGNACSEHTRFMLLKKHLYPRVSLIRSLRGIVNSGNYIRMCIHRLIYKSDMLWHRQLWRFL